MFQPKLRVTTVVGTRPEIIRLAAIIKKFDSIFDHRLIHTGQNSDPSLSEVFFRDLELRQPDSMLGITNTSLGNFLGSLFVEAEKELTANRPDALVILGDTNSSLFALIAKRMQIPVYHLEAGNRSFDANVPEEINRRAIDHLSDINMAYTSHARQNLLREGLHPRSVAVIGSPLKEVLTEVLPRVNMERVLSELKLKSKSYFLVSVHRQENVDSPERLTMLLNTFRAIHSKYKMPIMISTHPRTQMRLGNTDELENLGITFHKPFGFLDYLALQLSARVVLSDSGSISEEAAILGFPAVTLRDSMERPEALETGSILMCGIQQNQVLQALDFVEKYPQIAASPQDYEISDTSHRVASLILSTVHQINFWNGIRPLYEK